MHINPSLSNNKQNKSNKRVDRVKSPKSALYISTYTVLRIIYTGDDVVSFM